MLDIKNFWHMYLTREYKKSDFSLIFKYINLSDFKSSIDLYTKLYKKYDIVNNVKDLYNINLFYLDFDPLYNYNTEYSYNVINDILINLKIIQPVRNYQIISIRFTADHKLNIQYFIPKDIFGMIDIPILLNVSKDITLYSFIFDIDLDES